MVCSTFVFRSFPFTKASHPYPREELKTSPSSFVKLGGTVEDAGWKFTKNGNSGIGEEFNSGFGEVLEVRSGERYETGVGDGLESGFREGFEIGVGDGLESGFREGFEIGVGSGSAFSEVNVAPAT
jgi:hypothetical protein